jgi:hypothetical protein
MIEFFFKNPKKRRLIKSEWVISFTYFGYYIDIYNLFEDVVQQHLVSVYAFKKLKPRK